MSNDGPELKKITEGTSDAKAKKRETVVYIPKKSDIKKDALLYEMIQSQFGISRLTFKNNHRDRLIKMSGVSKEKYEVNQVKYNIEIREKILKGEILPLNDYADSFTLFDKEKQKGIQGLITEGVFTQGQIENYISNLTTTQIDDLNTQFDARSFVGFLSKELIGLKEKTDDIMDNGGELQEKTVEQIANLQYLEDLQKRIQDFVEKNAILKEKFVMVYKGLEFADKDVQLGYQEYFKKAKEENIEAYKKLVEKQGSEKKADEFLRTQYVLESIKKSDEYAKLDDDQKQEFHTIVQDFYTYSESLGIDPMDFGLGALYSDTLDYFNEKNEKNATYTALVHDVSIDDDIQIFFEDNTIETLVEKDQKDKEYYTKLLTFYPDFDKDLSSGEQKTLSSYITYFTDDLTIDNDKIKNLSLSEQENLQRIQKKLQAATQLGEESLIKETNTIVQNTAIENCISMLQEYMDIDISEKENIKEQFMLASNDTDRVQTDKKNNPVLAIKGTMNGTDLDLSYNLGSGKIYCKNTISKPKDSETSPIYINDTDEENNEIPLITLPTLSNFTDAAKKVEYKKIITKSTSLDEYTTNLRSALQGSVQIDSKWDMGTAKDMFKETVLKNSNMQKVLKLLGRPTDISKGITNAQSPDMHGFYTYFYNSLTYSPDQLDQLRENLTFLEGIRNSALTKDMQDIGSMKEDNPEKFVMRSMCNQKNIPQTTTNRSNQSPETIFMSFFSCFGKKVGGISVIDIEMFNDYIETSMLSKSTNGKGKWTGKSEKFIKLVNDMETNIGQHQASIDLDAQLKTVYNLPR